MVEEHDEEHVEDDFDDAALEASVEARSAHPHRAVPHSPPPIGGGRGTDRGDAVGNVAPVRPDYECYQHLALHDRDLLPESVYWDRKRPFWPYHVPYVTGCQRTDRERQEAERQRALRDPAANRPPRVEPPAESDDAVERPTLLATEDGRVILRGGGDLVWLYGEPGTGKSWFSLLAACAIIDRGEGCSVVVDLERSGVHFERIKVLGRNPAADGHCLQTGPAVVQLHPDLAARSLVVIDSASSAGLGRADGHGIDDWLAIWVRPWRDQGVTVMVVDHVGKYGGEDPVGSGAKKQASDVTFKTERMPDQAMWNSRKAGAARLICKRNNIDAGDFAEGDTLTLSFAPDSGFSLLAGSHDPVREIMADIVASKGRMSQTALIAEARALHATGKNKRLHQIAKEILSND